LRKRELAQNWHFALSDDFCDKNLPTPVCIETNEPLLVGLAGFFEQTAQMMPDCTFAHFQSNGKRLVVFSRKQPVQKLFFTRRPIKGGSKGASLGFAFPAQGFQPQRYAT
jgi:hypothetical protein